MKEDLGAKSQQFPQLVMIVGSNDGNGAPGARENRLPSPSPSRSMLRALSGTRQSSV